MKQSRGGSETWTDFLQIREQQYTIEVLSLTSKLLTFNPEYYSIWNARRRLFVHGLFSNPCSGESKSTPSGSLPTAATLNAAVESSSSPSTSPAASTTTPPSVHHQSPGTSGTDLDLIQDELNFLLPLLMKYPKCYWIWGHRLWLLQQSTNRLDASTARRLWEAELGLVGKMLTVDSRNFHGWGYRSMIVTALESPALQGQSMVEGEFAYTTKMIKTNLSNFSAWHRRSKLIPRLLDERHASESTRKQFLDDGTQPSPANPCITKSGCRIPPNPTRTHRPI